jgi:oleandomycin transport system ATP-binding protein
VLEVRPVDAARLATVAAIVRDLVEVAPEVNVGSGTVTVQMSDSSVLGEVVRRLDHAGIVLTDLALRGPSLDEVFLSLTGRRAGSEPTAKEEIAV